MTHIFYAVILMFIVLWAVICSVLSILCTIKQTVAPWWVSVTNLAVFGCVVVWMLKDL